MLEARTIGVSVERNWKTLYDAIWRPQDFTRWASGLTRSPLAKEGKRWRTEGPEGPISIRFTGYNPFGVMDHSVYLAGEVEVYVPMRVVANGAGAEVLFTLFRQPGMSDEKYEADAEWVARDLAALKSLVANGAI
jgi:hypothetical protein